MSESTAWPSTGPAADPLKLFRAWLADAHARQVAGPRAVVLATTGDDGGPSQRVVILRDVDEHGLIFTSSTTSRKGRELAANPRASMNFYWREVMRQVEVLGRVGQLPPEIADRYFDGRSEAARAVAIVSAQSAPLASEEELRSQCEELRGRAEPLRRPDHQVAYRLVPDCFEFWQWREDEVHRRLRYDRRAGSWSATRLQP
ncbi:pyridoxamine 5'-phosphate oxidase [Kocuria coralli]|uniref:Pyridoxamine 5'-phosphate oxidase n=1 Tax=Kocuria coralli TaxID=1461025 RepID=A0A5J5KW95_9MICC|nr:pyridoxal 5'-phosphate synthase [Kocuria coralli]KAA9393884.1 pyridoxamine 5'-phosphate oxidase [Kocuria coralli]